MAGIRTRITPRGVIQEPTVDNEPADFIIDIPTTLQGVTLTGGGGGGGTVIADGDTISGTFQGNVLCLGEVSVTGTLEVLGDLIVRGDFINEGGYEVTIRGNLTAQGILFNKLDTSTPQSNFTVDGNLIFTQFNFEQCGGAAAELRVGGDLTGAVGYGGSTIYGSGVNDTDTNGLGILVYGDVTVYEIFINGSDGTTVPAGNGGYMTVWGSANIGDDFTARGGDATDQAAGSGGDLYVWGTLNAGYAEISLIGGSANNGNAGNGGDLEVAGNVIANEIYLYGGNCDSNSGFHRAGSGGQIYIDGDAVVNNYISIAGGSRSGAIESNEGSFDPPDGGYMSIGGNVTLDGDFAGEGGDVNTINFSPHNAGSGAAVFIDGNLTCTDDFRAYGGYSNVGNAGNGGTANIGGAVFVRDEFEFYGGDSNGGDAGNGGSISIGSHAHIDEFSIQGGYSNAGNGGDGGDIYVDGYITLESYIYTRGGSCDSTDEAHRAGQGGDIECLGLSGHENNSYIYTYAGDRDGATTAPSNNAPSFGGNFDCYSNATFHELSTNGGSVGSTYPNGAGGNGGYVNIRGSVKCTYIYATGGGSEGGNAGDGGYISVGGHAIAYTIQTGGGGADDSEGVGSDAGVNGRHGDISLLRGANVTSVEALDGAGVGAGAPGTSKAIMLGGHCFIGILDVEDSLDTIICRDDGNIGTPIPTLLKVDSMPNKTTLNAPDGTPTVDIFGLISDSIFITNSGGGWLSITGAAII